MENDLFYAMVWITYIMEKVTLTASMENDRMENDLVPQKLIVSYFRE